MKRRCLISFPSQIFCQKLPGISRKIQVRLCNTQVNNTAEHSNKGAKRKKSRNKDSDLCWLFNNAAAYSPPLDTDVHRARMIFSKGKPGLYLGTAHKNNDFQNLNPDSPEFAFVGRSNVGKSSLLNSLLHLPKNKGARVSKTPGRTKTGHSFGIGSNEQWKSRNLPSWELVAVDLPGYGFAKVPRHVAEDMSEIVRNYLGSRSRHNQLLCVFLLLDARHGITPNDSHMIEHLNQIGAPFQAVLTKCDTVSSARLNLISREVVDELSKPNNVVSSPQLLGVSSKNGAGLLQIQAEMIKLVRENASDRVLKLRNRRKQQTV